MRVKDRQPRKIGARTFAFVAQGYPSTINSQARKLKARGYYYRIYVQGRQRLLYIGPKQRKSSKKTKKLKKTKKTKKSK